MRTLGSSSVAGSEVMGVGQSRPARIARLSDRAPAFPRRVCGNRKRMHLSLPDMKVSRHTGGQESICHQFGVAAQLIGTGMDHHRWQFRDGLLRPDRPTVPARRPP